MLWMIVKATPKLEELIVKLEKCICNLEETVEEQKYEKNVIVKGIQEVKDENWSNTKDIVPASFSQLLDIPKQMVYEGIERAHRGGKKLGNSQRNIYM